MFSPDGRCSPGDSTEKNWEQCLASQLVLAFDSLQFPYQICSGLLGTLIISSSFSPFILGLLPRERQMSRAWNKKYVSCYLPPAFWKVPLRNEMSNLNLTNLPWHQGGKPGRLGKSAAFCHDEGSGRPLGLTDVRKIKEHLSIVLRDVDKTSITQKIVSRVKVVFYFFVTEWIRK